MAQLTANEFRELLILGHERRGLEVKSPGPWSKRKHPDLFGKVIRAMLAMANRQDGGLIIIGIDDNGTNLGLAGLSAEDAKSWDRDSIGDAIAEYADPIVRFDVQHLSVDEKCFVILHVREFDEVPIICKRNLHDIRNRTLLRRGACYVRSQRKPESIEIPGQQEMREILDLAAQKRLRWFVTQLRRAGIDIESATASSDATRFDQQIADFLE